MPSFRAGQHLLQVKKHMFVSTVDRPYVPVSRTTTVGLRVIDVVEDQDSDVHDVRIAIL